MNAQPVAPPPALPALRPPGAQPSPTAPAQNFGPNERQAVARFKTPTASVRTARELTGVVTGWVRSAVEPIATVTLDPTKARVQDLLRVEELKQGIRDCRDVLINCNQRLVYAQAKQKLALGENIDEIKPWFHRFDAVLVAAGLAAAVWFVRKQVKARRALS